MEGSGGSWQVGNVDGFGYGLSAHSMRLTGVGFDSNYRCGVETNEELPRSVHCCAFVY